VKQPPGRRETAAGSGASQPVGGEVPGHEPRDVLR
jgi:hypothetical protein